MSDSNAIGDFSLDTINIRKPLTFPDGTTQSTAYTVPSSSPVGTYTNANITVNSAGQITNATNGSVVSSNVYNQPQIWNSSYAGTYNNISTITNPVCTINLAFPPANTGDFYGFNTIVEISFNASASNGTIPVSNTNLYSHWGIYNLNVSPLQSIAQPPAPSPTTGTYFLTGYAQNTQQQSTANNIFVAQVFTYNGTPYTFSPCSFNYIGNNQITLTFDFSLGVSSSGGIPFPLSNLVYVSATVRVVNGSSGFVLDNNNTTTITLPTDNTTYPTYPTILS